MWQQVEEMRDLVMISTFKVKVQKWGGLCSLDISLFELKTAAYINVVTCVDGVIPDRRGTR